MGCRVIGRIVRLLLAYPSFPESANEDQDIEDLTRKCDARLDKEKGKY